MSKNNMLTNSVEKVVLSDGEYYGTWGGNMVTIEHGNAKYSFKVEYAIREPWAPVKIIVEDGWAFIYEY